MDDIILTEEPSRTKKEDLVKIKELTRKVMIFEKFNLQHRAFSTQQMVEKIKNMFDGESDED